MKTNILTALLIIVLSAASFAEEVPIGETSKFKMVSKSDSKYDLYYASEKEAYVNVSIFDAKGKLLNEYLIEETKSFKKTFDFSQLDAGEYTITVSNDKGKATQVIKHKVKEKVLQSLVAKLPDSKEVKLHVGKFNSEEPVVVRIFNEDNKVIHRDEIENDKSFSKIYNLEEIRTNSVKVVVENNGELQRFVHDFK